MMPTVAVKSWLQLAIIIVLWPACRKETTVERNIKAEMLAAVNALRQTGCTCGATYMPPVKPLIWHDTLASAALAHARDMDANNYFNHISPGGTSPIQRAMALGYAGNTVTENIAKGYTSIETLMEAWQQSESHCKAMMDSLPTEMGAANVNTYWVQEFGH
ncbi:CAP domain-containing protein [Niastella caeni]|nr:CAP domain-containing protein [Niastella caeni]